MKPRYVTPWALVVAAVLVVSILPGVARAQSVAGAASLQIPPGARAEGMGRFFTSVADDAFSPWWNPAGLAFMRNWNAGLMHTKLVPGLADDVYFEYAGVSTYLEGWGGVAATLTYLTYGESQATNTGSPDPIDSFSSYEVSPSVALGTAIVPNLGVGINLKLVHVNLTSGLIGASDVGEGKGTTFAADLGALWRGGGQMDDFFGMGAAATNFGLGVTVANLGPDISLVDERESDPLPRNLKVAVSAGATVPESFSVLAGFAVEKSLIFEDIPNDEDLSFFERNDVLLSGGIELGFVDLVFGRLGYVYDDPGEIKNFTYGAGFHLKNFGIDIASIPQFEELDRVTKFSIVARFN